ncbi:putative ATP-dependent DNA helicase HFM1 [Genypterus blacodes]|uniref:putative ATP-dependent DNA helicase HFM1 n=1 Tax=Genypterus blacodes TaxID=154954 RepID=UPI003F75F1D6
MWPDEMLGSDDFTLPLDNLFFEKPLVHKVEPLHQEACSRQLEVTPSFRQIPASHNVQEEAECLPTLYSFSQKPRKFLPSFMESVGFDTSTSKVTNSNSFNVKEVENYQCGRSSSDRFDGLWGGEGFTDFLQGADWSDGGAYGTPLISGHAVISRGLSLDYSKSPPLRRSLFKPQRGQVLNSGGDSSNINDLSSSSQTASRPQTFLSQVSMVTEPPRLQPLTATATASQAVPPLSPNPPFLPPPVGSSAASGRPLQQATRAVRQDKGTKRAFVPPMTPQPLSIPGSSGSGVLRPVSEIPAKFRSVFKDFPFFNYVQSKALDDVLYSGRNFVACAPTGSGKTVLFELAIIRLLMETSEPWRDVKAVYMAPIKALCSQCYESWKKKFSPLGVSCKELTGDTEIDDFFEIQDAHIILTTPEKWDSMTRKWKDNCLLQLVRLFLIDEVHVVKDITRGATLEVVVSRMKTVHAYRTAENKQADISMRFVAVSATIPNISDIADWLSDESGPATYLEMDESHRPVKLRKVVLGFPCSSNQTEFKFDLSLNYKMANIIQTYSDQKPALVFCSTRKGVQQSASVLAKDARFIMSIDHKQRLMNYANSILDSKLRDLVMLGVGYHHAGVELSDRKLIEEAFTAGELPVLFTTRTLAMGVNLPAHLVVIKSTMQYVAGSCEEYSEADLLQMIGRAGRPQFDTSATAVIMTKFQTKERYMKLVSGVEIIESSLHSHLVEHLNAEIVLQTISDVSMALDWIRSTFLYIRALKKPAHYGFSAVLDRYGVEAKLQELCLKNLNSLVSIGLINMDEDINIKPTEAGRLMARYCVAFDTMKQFSKVAGTESLSELIDLVSKSREFSIIQLRMNEKRPLNTLNRDRNRVTIRFPMEGKIKTNEMKVNCLIQAQLGSISIQEFGLTQDTAKIFRNGMRISRCLSEFLSQRSKTGFSALLNSLIMAKCFRAKLWDNSPYVSKQLEKIGLTLSTAMVNAGLTAFSKIEQSNPRELELIVNRHPPFGNQIRESVINLPKYEVSLEQLPRYSCSTAEIVMKLNLKNQAQLQSKRTAPDYHYVTLIIGDSDNTVVFLQKVLDSVLLRCGSWSKKIDVVRASKGEEISVNLISSEYVGLDIQQTFSVFYSGAKKFGADNPYNTSYNPPRQRAQHSVLNPQPTTQAEQQRENATSATEHDVGSKRQCNHYCKNKDLCGHDCCKVGVAVVVPRRNEESGFSCHLRDLRSRCDTFHQPPVKRLKMKMSEESVSVQQFAYKPKERLHSVSSYGGNQNEALVRPHSETMDLTQEVPDIIYVDEQDSDDDFMEEMHEIVGESVQTLGATYPHFQRTSTWKPPGVSAGVSLNSTPQLNQISGTSTYSTAATYCNNVSLPIPSVSFDLGNEWDDFDDENLMLSSEMPSSLQTPNAKTQDQESDYYIQGCATTSAPVILSQAQVKPCMTAASTPLRFVSPTVSPEIRTLGHWAGAVGPQNRVTLDWNKKRQATFLKDPSVKTPEILPKQTETRTTPLTPRFDFFSAMSAPDSRSSNSKEEEDFLGIFDGIF